MYLVICGAVALMTTIKDFEVIPNYGSDSLNLSLIKGNQSHII